MQPKHLIVFLFYVLTSIRQLSAQKITTYSYPKKFRHSAVVIDKHLQDTFSFTRQWAYPWYTLNNMGRFSFDIQDTVLARDTAHLFFTADCKTDIQGGYVIRYCYATKNRDTLTLTFDDGAPAYGSMFYVYVTGDSFYFKPWTLYPLSLAGEKFTYRIIKQNIILNNNSYALGDRIIGYIDVEFVEIYDAPGRHTDQNKHYLKGYISTTLGTEKVHYPTPP